MRVPAFSTSLPKLIVHLFDHSHPIDFPLYLSCQSLLTNQPNDFFFLFLFTNYKVLLRKILYSWPLVSPPHNWSSIAIRVIFYFLQGRGLHWVFFAPHRLSRCSVATLENSWCSHFGKQLAVPQKVNFRFWFLPILSLRLLWWLAWIDSVNSVSSMCSLLMFLLFLFVSLASLVSYWSG